MLLVCRSSAICESLLMPSSRYIPVQDHANLARDGLSNAIVDVDTEAYARYVATRDARREQQERITRLENRINNFESDIQDIKALLTRLLEK